MLGAVMQSPPAIALLEMPEARDRRVARHIREAAEATGVPFDFLLAQANQESSLNPDARSSRSSAMGLYQFTAGTWLEMVKKHGAEHGLDHYADAIVKDRNGRWNVSDKDLKKEILDLRRDSKTSSLMAGEYAADNRKVLENRLGRKASTHDLYLAHFLGAGGALRVLQGVKDDQTTEAAGLLPDAAKANPEVFHNNDGTGESKSVEDLYSTVQRSFKRSMANMQSVAKNLNKPGLDLSALRPEARPRPQAEADALQTAALTAPNNALPPASESVAAHSPAPDLSRYDAYPVAIASAAADAQTFPVKLPPPLNAAKADQLTLRGLFDALTGKS